ncbi:MAG: gamma-glutamyltransferase [Ferrimicrobium sp.]
MEPLVPLVDQAFPRAAVATIDPLASSAALSVLRAGGSAIDAAIAANAVLSVTAPDQCGLGGDLFALIYEPASKRRAAHVHACEAIGRAGSGIDADALRGAGLTSIPRDHLAGTTVPGCVDGWLLLHERFGRLRLDQLLVDAINYGTEGFPVSERLLAHAAELDGLAAADLFTEAHTVGDRLRLPGTARTLEAIGRLGRDGFYAGEFGVELIGMGGGIYSAGDLAEPLAAWVAPLSVDALGYRLHATPPPSAGFLALAALAALAAKPTHPFGSVSWYQELIDTIASTAALHAYHSDRTDLPPLDDLVAEATRTVPEAATDTTAILCYDERGYGVVMIQSNAQSFGSRRTTPNTGIFLHNRGATGFSLEPGDPNELAPGARPRHTLCPVVATTPTGELALLAGTMGGDRQPTVLVQLIASVLRDEVDLTTALAQPRFAFYQTKASERSGFDTWDREEPPALALEGQLSVEITDELIAPAGDPHQGPAFDPGMGVAHLITRDASIIRAASDPRARGGTPVGY